MGADLHILDYVVLAASILISVGIGAWYARPGAKQRTAEAYLQGDRQLHLVPVIISLCVTYVSGITMLGAGAEVYYYGIEFVFLVFAQLLGTILTAALWVPLLYPLKLTSSNQYLRMRFKSNAVSLLGMVLQLLSVLLVCGITLYAPCTLFETLGVLPTWASLLIIGVSSTFYTSIGGIKGVIFTDVFQAIIMLVGLVTVTIQACIKVGGLSNAWKIYGDWGRINLDNFFVPNPLKRLDFWSCVPLQATVWFLIFGLMQASVQRYSSLPSKKLAIGCVLGCIPGNIIFMGLSCLCGLVMFSYYAMEGCDPLSGGKIKDVNQLLLYLVLDILYYPGVPGLFLAAIFCSSLSSLSSQLTAMAAFTWDDLLRLKLNHLSEKRKTILLKVLVCLFGLLSTGMGFLCLLLKGTLIKLVIMFTQALFVPFGILFISGASLPRINVKGTLLSSFISGAFVIWLMVGGELNPRKDRPLPLPMSTCLNATTPGLDIVVPTLNDVGYTTLDYTTVSGETGHNDSDGVFYLYRISHYWYGPFGFILGLILSITFSLIPFFREKDLIPENLIFPFARCCFPTQKVSHSGGDEKEMEKMIRNDNDVDQNLNDQKWLYKSPQGRRVTS